MIPKKAGSPDFRPIGVTCMVTRCLEKMLLRRYRAWTKDIQCTDALQVLFGVEDAVSRAVAQGSPLFIRQSDLSNCFTRLDAELANQLARAFGMRPKHADLFFGLNHRRPAIIRTGAVAGDWKVPDRGLAQGDPVSPLGAALYAAAHAAVLASEVPGVVFHTYVDDRTTVATTTQDLSSAVQVLHELDNLSGQKEDDSKEELAFVNASPQDFDMFSSARTDYLDLLGIRLDLNGSAPPRLAPKAKARTEQLALRLERLRKISRCLHLGEHRRQRAVATSLSLLRWDAAWIDCDLQTFSKLTTQIEITLQSRKRYAAWRHRGAAWIVQKQGWKLEPVAMATFAAVFAARRMQQSVWSEGLKDAWSHELGARSCLVDRIRDAYAKLHWGATESPYVVQLPQGRFDLSLVSDAVLSHLLRQGWRNHIMQNCVSSRHVSIDVDTIDSTPLHSFLERNRGSMWALAWRCVTAAEPNYERLAHIPNSGLGPACALCSAERGSTWHLMWQCPGTQHFRDKHRLELQDLENQVPANASSAFLQNAWAPAPVPPRSLDWTFDTVEVWIQGLLAEFRTRPPSRSQGRIFIATDGSAQNPAAPDIRVAAFSVAWPSGNEDCTWSQPLGRIETTVNAAEVVAVLVAASAAERAGIADAHFLTDHHAVLSGLAGATVSVGKSSLWRSLRAVLRRQSFEVSWVPAHGRSGHLKVPDFWRCLNKLADEAATTCSLEASAASSSWSTALTRRRSLVAKILHFKMDVFDDLYQKFLTFFGGH